MATDNWQLPSLRQIDSVMDPPNCFGTRTSAPARMRSYLDGPDQSSINALRVFASGKLPVKFSTSMAP